MNTGQIWRVDFSECSDIPITGEYPVDHSAFFHTADQAKDAAQAWEQDADGTFRRASITEQSVPTADFIVIYRPSARLRHTFLALIDDTGNKSKSDFDTILNIAKAVSGSSIWKIKLYPCGLVVLVAQIDAESGYPYFVTEIPDELRAELKNLCTPQDEKITVRLAGIWG